MPDIKTGVSVGGNLLGGALGAAGSKSAAKTQAKAADRATRAMQESYGTMLETLTPYTRAGSLASNKLATLLGLGSATPATVMRDASGVPTFNQTLYETDPAYRNAWDKTLDWHRTTYGRGYGDWSDTQTIEQQMQKYGYTPTSTPDPEYGALLQEFTGDDLENDPGYQFGLNQGMQALDRSASARGNLLSGATLKAAQRYGQDYAGTKFNEAFSRDNTTKTRAANFLSSVANMGQNSASQAGQAAMGVGQATANNIIGAGNASAAGTVGAYNALGGAFSNISNDYMLNRLYESANSNRIYQNASDTSYSGWDPKQLRAGTGAAWG